MSENYFYNMIKLLRKQEEIILYGNLLQISQDEGEAVVDFLRSEYTFESLSYPYTTPPFDNDAALWAAKTVYISAQLILYRENKTHDLSLLLPAHTSQPTAAAVLSADLCLRFIPDMLLQLKAIDSEDELIRMLEQLLQTWHFSAISYPINPGLLNFEIVNSNNCLKQLYINRIIQFKNTSLAMHESCREWIIANTGLYPDLLWPALRQEITTNGSN